MVTFNSKISLNKKLICVVLFLLGFIFSNAQWYDPEKVNKKATKLYEQAYSFAVEGKYQESIEKIGEAIKAYPNYVEAYLSRAGIYADLKNYQQSVKDFETGIGLDSVFSEYYFLPYSISLAGTGNFEKALAAINTFLNIKKLNRQSIEAGNYRKKTYQFAIQYKLEHISDNFLFEPKNVGSGINTKALEYFPSITIDGKEMVFNRRVNGDEDFYVSRVDNGKWTDAVPINGSINTTMNEGAQTISQDGQLLIFTGCNYPNGAGSCDLYVSYRNKNNEWTEPQNIGLSINTDFWESNPSLSPDKKDLYFSSNRPGGFGGKDIWVSHKNNKGYWGKPENAGPVINTKDDETCPFIHADNQHLYFNSNGHEGYGMSDLFVSSKNDSGNWMKPKNLGYPINTINDEGSLIVSSDGKTSFYASDFGNAENGLDIYSFELREDIRPFKTLWVKGHVYDKKSLKGLPSTVELADINNNKNISIIQTDEDGNYFLTLPVGKTYSFNVNRKGYLFHSNNFTLDKNILDSFYNLDIALNPLEKGASVTLKNIFFENNSYELKNTSWEELGKVIALMNENPSLVIEIEGHTDNSGSRESNFTLSNNRAKSVADYLTAKGISSKRLHYKGFGETMPIDSNENEKGKSNNRRTEIHILSN